MIALVSICSQLPDIWAVLIQPHVTHKQYLPTVYKARERAVHCKRENTVYLVEFSSYLPYTMGSYPSSYHRNTGWCCCLLACTHHGTKMKIMILSMLNKCWVVYLKLANHTMI